MGWSAEGDLPGDARSRAGMAEPGLLIRMSAAIRRFSPAYGRFLFRLPPSAKLLDVGCGDCSSLRIIRRLRPDLELYGVDLLERESCKDLLVDFRKADLNREGIGFPDGKFDGIRASHLLEHLENPAVLQVEIPRLLKPGGLAYVEAPNPNSLRVPSFPIFREQGGSFHFRDDPAHVRPYRTEELEAFLEWGGMEVLTSGVIRNPVKILLSPAILAGGLILRRRSWLTDAAWEISGWCSCAVGRKSA